MKILYTAAFIFLIPFTSSGIDSPDPTNYTIKVKNFSKRIYSEKRSRYRLISSEENLSLIEASNQRIIKIHTSKGKTIIDLITGGFKKVNIKKPATLSKFTIDTRFLNINSREVQKIAAKFRNSKNMISSVETFVYNYIKNKSAGIPLIPAVNIINCRCGDCTEHTILAVSILRTCKIPSRAVVGIFLAKNFEGRKNIFVFHMWAEAYINDRWEIVDASNTGKKFPNRYIAFAFHSLRTETPLAYLKAVTAINELKVEYLGN